MANLNHYLIIGRDGDTDYVFSSHTTRKAAERELAQLEGIQREAYLYPSPVVYRIERELHFLERLYGKSWIS